MKYRKTVLVISLVLLLLLIIFFPFSIPLTVETPGKLLAKKLWLLEKNLNGNISATVYNNNMGRVDQYFSTLPERGDTFQFNLIKTNTMTVSKGDTIAVIHSNLLSRQFAQNKKKLEVSKAKLKILLSGKKESLIREAEQKLNAAREKYTFLVKSAERKKELFQKGLLAIEDFEMAESEMRLGLIDVEEKEARLVTVKTGAKAEQILLVKNEISGYEQEYEILKEKQNQLVIKSPINGDKTYFFSSDTILSIQTAKKVLMIPLNWEYKALCDIGSSGEILDENKTIFDVTNINSNIYNFNNKQVVTVIAKPDFIQTSLPTNLWVMCQLNLGNVSLIDYLKWKLLYTFYS